MLLAGRDWLDRSVYQALYAGTRPSLIIIARFFTALGEPTVLIGASVCIALWLWYRRSGRLGLALLLITMTGRALSEVQKYWIARARLFCRRPGRLDGPPGPDALPDRSQHL